VFEGLNQHLDI